MSIKRPSHILLIISNICFISLYVITCYYNRLAIDDYHFMANVNEYGIWEGVIQEYISWSSRYTSLAVNHSFLSLEMNGNGGLFLFGIVSLALIVGCTYMLITQVGLRLNMVLGPFLKLNLALFGTSLLYYLTINIGETWHWLCSAATYLWAVIACIYLLAYVLRSQNQWWRHALAAGSAAYLGGASGPLALLVLLVLPIAYFSLSKSIYKLSGKRSLIALWVITAAAFIVLYRAEGNSVRSSFFEEVSIWQSITLNVKMTGILVLKKLRLSIFLLASLLIIPRILDSSSPLEHSKYASLITRSLLVFLALAFLYQWPITYKTQDIAAERAMLPLTLALILIGCYMALRMAPMLSDAARKWTSIVVLIATIAFAVQGSSAAITELPAYAKAHDSRTQTLKNLNDCEGKHWLAPLPSSGVLKSAEISSDVAIFSNMHLREAYDLPCMVYSAH